MVESIPALIAIYTNDIVEKEANTAWVFGCG
jgi:hypothetical protein